MGYRVYLYLYNKLPTIKEKSQLELKIEKKPI